MAIIKQPREIINRKNLLSRLRELILDQYDEQRHKAEILDLFKGEKRRGCSEINRRFEEENISGLEVICLNSYLVDQLVRSIYDVASKAVFPSHNPTTGEHIALLATGGYGRGELAPFSDVDIMFLIPYKLTARSEQVIEFTLYMLWDLGLKVGHATRSINDALRLSKEDLTIRTSLLECRLLWGNKSLYLDFIKRFEHEVVRSTGLDFVSGKLKERDERHRLMGDTRYLLEPNVKEGKGALRDLQTLSWIARYLYKAKRIDELLILNVLTRDDISRFKKAAKFLWTVRCHLHYLSGRPEERLSFDIQDEISRRMRYRNSNSSRGVERFMKHYFLIAKDVGDLTRTICSVLENQQKKSQRSNWFQSLRGKKTFVEGFEVDRGRVNVENQEEFKKFPVKLLKLFSIAQKNELDIHPDALRGVTQNLQLVNDSLRKDHSANEIFKNILLQKDPDLTLKRLNEAGVMGRFIPDFGRVVAQMQYDMYHVYTVDEHTIRAIGILYLIEKKKLIDDHPLACSVFDEIKSRAVLYFSVLLHDIAKGRGGDHSQLGSEIAKKLGPRFGFNEWETETLSWLVKYHLLMSRLAFKRDIEDPKTVSDFIKVVQSPERLRLLFLLTIVDISAVGPNVWNSWKAGLLSNLYLRAQEVLLGSTMHEDKNLRVERIKKRFQTAMAGWPKNKIKEYFKNTQSRYWLEIDPEVQVRHAKLIDKAKESKIDFKIGFHNDEKKEVIQVYVFAPDHPGLFASIAGAIALSNASIVDAKIQTLKNGMALDSFSISSQQGSRPLGEINLTKLERRIIGAIQGETNLISELASARTKVVLNQIQAFNIFPGVLIDNNASQSHTVLEINGRDRPGFLYDVTAFLTKSGFQISSAHISTYGERVVDVFYVRDVFGMKVLDEKKLNHIREQLLGVIGTGTRPQNNARKLENKANDSIYAGKQKLLL